MRYIQNLKKYRNFGDISGSLTELDSARIVILPIPYDKTSTWIKGADNGPLAILEASRALELYDIETDYEVYKHGIYTCQPIVTDSSPEEMVREVKKTVLGLLEDEKFVVTLGGEHSVSIGAAQAYADQFDDISVLQLDAHSDLRDEYEGSRYNHACAMARISEIAPIAQVGIRSMDSSEKSKLDSKNVFFARDICGKDDWIDKAVGCLKPNVYVTIDLDMFDPSIMPATGTPEPGGLDWYSVLRFLKSLSENKNVVGFDIAELCPMKDNKISDFTAAKLVYKFLSYVFKTKGK